MKFLLAMAFWIFLFPLTAAQADNFSPIDGAFDPGYERPAARRHLGPPSRSEDEAFHQRCLRDTEYALADSLLNITWKVLRRELPEAQFKSLQQDQRRWLSQGRERAAQRYLREMSEVKAFARATRDRVDELTSRIGILPNDGSYSASFGNFKVSVYGGRVDIKGGSYYRDSICDYEAHGNVKNGWIHMVGEYPDFYILFYPYGAEIYYNTSEAAQGCGFQAGFAGTYSSDN